VRPHDPGRGEAVEILNSSRAFARLVAPGPRRTLIGKQRAKEMLMTTFVLPNLPYPIDALAPTISADTMAVHYGKHHKGYVDKMNKLVADTSASVTTLSDAIRSSNSALAQAAAQAWNHEFFWRCLSPKKSTPSAELTAAIEAGFGSRRALEEKLKAAANELFGSGWVWLVKDQSGLKLASTPNAGLLVHETPVVPLLTVDVWEHAYYLDYKNERARYLNGVWELLNWGFASEQLARREGAHGLRA
jgi:Fe-Mn family superoxide dismutase